MGIKGHLIANSWKGLIHRGDPGLSNCPGLGPGELDLLEVGDKVIAGFGEVRAL